MKWRSQKRANGQQFARYWMHNGYINVDNTKMSKSLGNFFTVRDVAQKYGYEPDTVFYAVGALQKPYQLYGGYH